jgi:phenylalanine-4-hydroxylase
MEQALNPSPTNEVKDLVELDPDHPGFRDAAYRERRNAIAKLALEYKEGDPIPYANYTPEENEVWRTVWSSLGPVQDKNACKEYLTGRDKLALSREQIPQLREVSDRVAKLSGFRMLPVGGLVTARTFLSYLARDIFLSTQYIRHYSVPLYTPEPDVVHEMVGHAATLVRPSFVELNRAFGRAASRVDEKKLAAIVNVYWFTVEFGVAQEDGQPKAYGAGLLSSFGELGDFAKNAELRGFDIEEIGATSYDPTQYQKILFMAPSFEAACTKLMAWCDAL